MGRGRQKAKQTKVARKLKYYSPDTDFSALERELVAGESAEESDDSQYDDYADYSEYADYYDPDEDEPTGTDR